MKIEIKSVQKWNLFKGLSESDISKILTHSVQDENKSGDIICSQGAEGNSMFIIASGRVNVSVTKKNGATKNLNILQQGDHFGELVLLSGGTRTATAIAITDVITLEIERDDFFLLLAEIPYFSINLSQTISHWLQGELKGNQVRKQLNVLGLVRTSDITNNFILQLVDWFIKKGKKIVVFSDRPDEWHNFTLEHIFTISSQSVHKDVITAAVKFETVIIDIDHKSSNKELLNQCERVWWFLEHQPDNTNSLLKIIEETSKLYPPLKKRLQLVWTLEKSSNLSDLNTNIIKTNFRELRCQYNKNTKKLHRRDLSRFYHIVEGVHLGIALGGGGARCMAHIGVLAALEDNDLYFDRISGTSGGAIISSFYAAGFDTEKMLSLFKANLSPPKWMKLLPHGKKWYLMTLFRFGLIDKRFTQIFNETLFEQLLLPIHIVCSDLISGKEIIRSDGNVANSVLESINHPLLSKPIYRDGKSLVDGGVLNNIPSSVLRSSNVDYVVSVNIGAKLTQKFGKNGLGTSQVDMKKVGFLGTLSRVLEVGQDGLEKLYEEESDFVISPDTSIFLFEDFTKGKELFDVGYNATMKVMPELKVSYDNFLENK